MIKYIAIFILLSLNSLVCAQTVNLPIDYVRNTVVGNNIIPANVIGSPFAEKDWTIGTVQINDDIYTRELRYNAYQDEIEMKENGSVIALLKLNYIKAKINSKNYAIESFHSANGDIQQGYLNILNIGKFVLLARFEKELKQAQKAETSYQQDKPAQFVEKKAFYVKISDQEAIEVRLKEKDILNVLPKQIVTIAEDFIKKNKLKIKSEEQVIELFDYLNSNK